MWPRCLGTTVRILFHLMCSALQDRSPGLAVGAVGLDWEPQFEADVSSWRTAAERACRQQITGGGGGGSHDLGSAGAAAQFPKRSLRQLAGVVGDTVDNRRFSWRLFVSYIKSVVVRLQQFKDELLFASINLVSPFTRRGRT